MIQFTPTLAQQDLILGFNDQLSLYGHTLTYSGTNFPCLMTPANPAEPEFLSNAFPDPREVSIAFALGTSNVSGVVAQSTLTDEMGQQWTALKKVENPSEITTQIWLQKVVAGVDTD